jgi:hypothetical protein
MRQLQEQLITPKLRYSLFVGIIANLSQVKIEANILIPWIEKWIDIEGTRHSAYSNSIHNCSMVEKSDNAVEITVDFGTAPIKSMTELLNLLAIDNKKLVIK